VIAESVRALEQLMEEHSGRVFRLVEFREDRLYASQEVGAGVG